MITAILVAFGLFFLAALGFILNFVLPVLGVLLVIWIIYKFVKWLMKKDQEAETVEVEAETEDKQDGAS